MNTAYLLVMICHVAVLAFSWPALQRACDKARWGTVAAGFLFPPLSWLWLIPGGIEARRDRRERLSFESRYRDQQVADELRARDVEFWREQARTGDLVSAWCAIDLLAMWGVSVEPEPEPAPKAIPEGKQDPGREPHWVRDERYRMEREKREHARRGDQAMVARVDYMLEQMAFVYVGTHTTEQTLRDGCACRNCNKERARMAIGGDRDELVHAIAVAMGSAPAEPNVRMTWAATDCTYTVVTRSGRTVRLTETAVREYVQIVELIDRNGGWVNEIYT